MRSDSPTAGTHLDDARTLPHLPYLSAGAHRKLGSQIRHRRLPESPVPRNTLASTPSNPRHLSFSHLSRRASYALSLDVHLSAAIHGDVRRSSFSDERRVKPRTDRRSRKVEDLWGRRRPWTSARLGRYGDVTSRRYWGSDEGA